MANGLVLGALFPSALALPSGGAGRSKRFGRFRATISSREVPTARIRSRVEDEGEECGIFAKPTTSSEARCDYHPVLGEMALPRSGFAKIEISSSLPPGSTGREAQAFIFGGFIAGLAMAMSSLIFSLSKRERRVTQTLPVTKSLPVDLEERRREEASATVVATVESEGEEQRIAKIRDMARQANIEEEAVNGAAESVPRHLRFAAAARAQLVRMQQEVQEDKTNAFDGQSLANEKSVPGSDYIELARQLDRIRESANMDYEEKPLGSSVNSEVVINGHSDENELHGDADIPDSKRATSRFITTLEEARQVLASDKYAKSTREDTLLSPSPGMWNSDSSPPSLKPSEAESRQSDPSGGIPRQHIWEKDDVIRNILLKAQDNEKTGKPLFQGMPPDAKDVLFRGLEKELGPEAEPIKDWILERNAANERKKPQILDTDEMTATISREEKKKEWQPDCNPQKTVVTGSGGAAAKHPKVNDPRSLKNDVKSRKKKVWPKELQRRYDAETDPKMRKLLKEIGKDLDEWLTEEEVEETLRLFFQGPDGRRELLRRWCAELQEEAKKQGETLGNEEMERFANLQEKYKRQSLQDMVNKYDYYRPTKPDTLWWLKLRYVACVALRNDEQKVTPGLYSMNMALEGESEEKMNVVGFEDHNEALNFCRTLVPELDKLGGATNAGVIPFEPKELFREASDCGFDVTVLRKGQVENYAGKPLEEVEYRILEIGRDVYVQERLRERSIDIKAMMKDIESDLY